MKENKQGMNIIMKPLYESIHVCLLQNNNRQTNRLNQLYGGCSLVRKSPTKYQLSILNSSREIYVFPIHDIKTSSPANKSDVRF